MNAAHRLTPTRGSSNKSAATVRTLAAAGTMRTLSGELSTFCTAYKTNGYSIGEEFLLRVFSRTACMEPLELFAATASSYDRKCPVRL